MLMVVVVKNEAKIVDKKNVKKKKSNQREDLMEDI